MQHGGHILVDALKTQGVDMVFCVPGESYLAVLDALHDHTDIRTIVCRQEGGAAMMADAHARLTGRPGVCLVTRGPGATNAAIGIHIAQQDSTPLVMFVGLPGSDMTDREAFQEFDLRAVFGSLAKSAEVVTDIRRLPEYVARAFHAAQNGRPGPVVLGLPEDVLSASAQIAGAPRARVASAAPTPADMAELVQLLNKAERPLMIVGGPGWSAAVQAQCEAVAEQLQMPVACSFRAQDHIDNRDPCYAGHVGIGIDPRLAKRVQEADLLIAVGARLGEMTTSGYTLVTSPEPSQILVHVHPSGDELGRVFHADLPIASSSAAFIAALAASVPAITQRWTDAMRAAHADVLAFAEPQWTPGDVKQEEIVAALVERLPRNAIITNGAGNYTAWLHRYYPYRQYRTQLAPTCGAMGYGLPAAIAAKLTYPDRMVIAYAGDGCFLMNGQELATAKQYGANVITIVVNNGMYGTIRMHQEKHYPGRVWGTDLANPDFATLARAYGCHGEVVEETAQFGPALDRCIAAAVPALIELRVDPQAITPRQTLADFRDRR
jgi:acetolactate synthase I/II/III large subunit